MTKTATFLVLGLGALAIYKWNKMSEDEKDALREKGKRILQDHLAPILKKSFGVPEEIAEAAKDAVT